MWAALGDYDKALKIAKSILKPNEPGPHMACGDIAMYAGRYDEALQFYKTAAGITNPKYKGSMAGTKERIVALQAIQGLDLAKVRNGTFRASTNGYSGAITVSVSVKSQRITDVKIVKHIEKQYYSSLTDIPSQIIAKQSITGIDSTSGATITSMCIIRAAGKALRRGMR